MSVDKFVGGGLEEALLDLRREGSGLGGTSTNFAFMINFLGNRAGKGSSRMHLKEFSRTARIQSSSQRARATLNRVEGLERN
jgi:hypothetical protein